jgi:hypothetical protein
LFELSPTSHWTNSPFVRTDAIYIGANYTVISYFLLLGRLIEFCEKLRNDTWSFESVRYNKGVTRTGKYAFDVLIKTKGIIQIGWVTPGYLFDPDAGLGVGDDEFSYSIDGQRAKKWHGLNPENVKSCTITFKKLLIHLRTLTDENGRLEI